MSDDIDIAVRVTAPAWRRAVPDAAEIAASAARAALRCRGARAILRGALGVVQPAELAIVLADDRTVRTLNYRYRGIDKPTNVLSFPAHDFAAPAGEPRGGPAPLGDIALACQTVCREAAAQGKPVGEHLAHLVVHGTLHLLGYDHQDGATARRMEGVEARVLAGLGIANPYRAGPVRRRRAA